ncbi:hypothetical protein Taro_037183 [Colocasia esculenta]|uniref:Uncharacterized protein n=1 Tax=Colocasia esculenta TaxID=4460 RepID=A0A843W8Z8_COLES|nr:hypothetical protein [Colocasia esculenta]
MEDAIYYGLVSSCPPQKCVDTVSGRVDTRPNIQKTRFAQVGQCVDTLNGSVDTLRLKSQHLIYLDKWLLGDQGNMPRQESPYTSIRSFLAAKRGFPDLDPSPEVAGHPFKRKDMGIKGNL